MPTESTGLQLTTDLLFQGLVGLLVGLWALKDFLKYRRETRATLAPNPVVAAATLQWDRDQQERLLQLIERIAAAQEAQAKHQSTLAEQQQADMKQRMDDLLDALREREDRLSASVGRRR